MCAVRRMSKVQASEIADRYIRCDGADNPSAATAANHGEPEVFDDDSDLTGEGGERELQSAESTAETRDDLKKRAKVQKPLSPKQGIFVNEYVKDFNATRAAIAAGYSEKTASVTGSRLLRIVKVRNAIDEIIETHAKRLHFDHERAIEMLVSKVTADDADLFDNRGRLKPVEKMPMPYRMGLLKKITVTEKYIGKGDEREHFVTVTTVELQDRFKFFNLLAKHLGVADADNDADKRDLDQKLEEFKAELANTPFRIDPRNAIQPRSMENGDVLDTEYETIKPKEQ